MSTGAFDKLAEGLVDVMDNQPRQYLAGPGPYRYSGRVTTGEKWPNGLSASGTGAVIHHTLTRRNARTAMQDSVQARSVVTRTADTVADGGLRLELCPNADILGISKEEATEKGRDISMRFHLYASDVKAHRAEQFNFYRAQGHWAFFRQRDNDQFVRLYYTEDDSRLQNPLQFEFIDADQIRGDAFTNLYGFNVATTTNGFQYLLFDGIERDDRGRENAYKVWTRNPDGTYGSTRVPATYPGGRRGMIHGFEGEYAGQGRGYTRLAHAIQEFENITDFSAAVIKKAINQSCIVGFIEPSKEEDAVNPFEGVLTNQGAGPAQSLFSSNSALASGAVSTANPSTELAAGIDTCYQVPEATFDTPGSMFVASLTKGSKITFPANTAPGDSYGDFVGDFAGYIAASLNIPLEVVLMKFGQNYSASRATLLLFWDVVRQERIYMAAQFLNPVVEMWLAGEIAAGRIQCPGWSDPRMRAAWLNCTWVGGGPPDIDPAKSVKARRDAIELGITNADREARDHNGSSAADNIAANNKLYAPYKALPWNEPGNAPPGSPQPAKPAVVKQLARQLADIQDMLEEALNG